MKPLIGITTTEIGVKTSWVPVSYGHNRQYSDAVLAAGGIPVLIPFMDEAGLRDVYERLDGILFPGGNDVNPEMYGEEPKARTKDISPERDRVESTLMRWAIADDKPILAICRGFQLFNVVFGGTLYQDILLEIPGAQDHELSTFKEDKTHIAHTLTLLEGSQLATIMQARSVRANSHHHQGAKRIATELRACAWSEDGLVEALEHPLKKFAVGVQCHPESLFMSIPEWASVFNSFVRSASAQESLQPASALSSSITV